MYRRKREYANNYDDFLLTLNKLPEDCHCCSVAGDLFVVDEALKDNLYLKLSKHQRDVEYYIPTVEEIEAFANDHYPSNDESYQKLLQFFTEDLKLSEIQGGLYCMTAFQIASAESSPTDFFEYLNEEKIVFNSDKQLEKFLQIYIEAANQTRRFELKGHTPNEMRKLLPYRPSKGLPTIVPMSSHAAALLEEGRNEIEKMGFALDLDSTAAEMPLLKFPQGVSQKADISAKKIYPNDPCPCGSGKKYKKCCGKNK